MPPSGPLRGDVDVGLAAGLGCASCCGDPGVRGGVVEGVADLVSVGVFGVPMAAEPRGEPGAMPDE